jgi:hypothetical protein
MSIRPLSGPGLSKAGNVIETLRRWRIATRVVLLVGLGVVVSAVLLAGGAGGLP